MSVELRITDDHVVECDWGVIEHGDPRPDRGQIGHLMLTMRDYVDQLAKDGPCLWAHKGYRCDHAFFDGGRVFVRSTWRDQSWTWELFDAHWSDGCKWPIGLMVGRWPD
jgi:hypothetical protein